MTQATHRPNRRQRQAEQTHREILSAARSLFATQGYRATTMRDIAEAANASIQTVYTSVGTKSRLVLELNDLIDSEAGVGEIVREALSDPNPEVALAAGPRVARALIEHCGDIIRVAMEGAAHEADLAELMREGHRRHMAGIETLVRRLAAVGAIPGDTDPAALTKDIAVITDVSLALLLVDQYGWSPEEVEAWMLDTLRALVPRT